ncbi:MAG TPA: YicC/YloC family endoribonuclease [Myxococcota bacterium]
MIRSMTGFGRAGFGVQDVRFDIEVRSVNHRFLDARIRMPKPLAPHEADVRAAIQRRFDRGKVDLTVASPGGEAKVNKLEIDLAAAQQYLRAAAALREAEGVSGELGVASVLSLPGVARFVEAELPAAELREGLLASVESALEALDGMRAAEGAALERDLLARLDQVARLTEFLEQRSGLVQDAVRERLRKRAQQLGQEAGLIDPARLHQEIVIAADRLDVTEELVRLRSHVEQFRAILAGAGPRSPVGRRLDFLLQEFGREANTVGSKGSDAPIAHQIVELKTEIERMREQVQNVE